MHNNNVLESRINTLTKTSKDLKPERTFKEDYYILQQSHDTNVILLVFGSLVAFSGLFNYINLRDQYSKEVEEIKREIKREIDNFKIIMNESEDKIETFKLKMKESEDELDNFKNYYYLERVDLDQERADNYFKKGDKKNYLVYNLSAANKICDFYLWAVKKDEETESLPTIVKGITNLLTTVNSKLNDKVEIDKIQMAILEDYFRSLRSIDDKELNKILSIIHVKINETNK